MSQNCSNCPQSWEMSSTAKSCLILCWLIPFKSLLVLEYRTDKHCPDVSNIQLLQLLQLIHRGECNVPWSLRRFSRHRFTCTSARPPLEIFGIPAKNNEEMAAFNGGYTYRLLCGARKRNDEKPFSFMWSELTWNDENLREEHILEEGWKGVKGSGKLF